MTVKSYLSLGTNIGDRKKNLANAKLKINRSLGKITAESSIYETEPWGFTTDQNFYNQVIAISTQLKPQKLLSECMKIEKELGRKRCSGEYESREIDIDILFYGKEIVREINLNIPHPKLHDRNFVLYPLAEIEPQLLHPIFKKNVLQLLDEKKDSCWIKKIPLPK